MNLASDAAQKLYPRIPDRIKAGEIDALIIVAVLFTLIGSYVAIGRETPAIIFICIAVLLLYEPVLVTWRGQTIGHKIMGFRIVDSVTHANISFPKSLARFILKAVIGVVSVIWAFFEQQQQFLHDKMTKSLAVMCEVSVDQLRIQPAASVMGVGDGSSLVAMPSLRRRVAFIMLYVIGASILLFTIVAMMFPGCASESPMAPEQCHIVDSITGGLFIVLLLSIITAGLRGGLPGARKMESDPN